MSSAIDVAEIRTAAPGLGFPQLSGRTTAPLGWPAPDRVSRETSGPATAPQQPTPSAPPAIPPNEITEPATPALAPSEHTTPETPTGTREDRMDATTHDDTEVRAQIAAAMPGADAQTPLAAAVAADARKRITLSGRTVPRPALTRVLHGREPEGWCRQDDHHGQRCGRAGPGRLHVLVIDLDPQGNASTALGMDHHAEVPTSTTSWSRAGRWSRSSRSHGHPRPVLRTGHHRPGRRGDRAGLAGRAREPAAQGRLAYLDTAGGGGAPRLRAHRLPAQSRAAHPERLRGGRRGVHPDPVRVLRTRRAVAAAENVEMVATTSTRTWRSRRSCSPCTTAAPGSRPVADEVRKHFGGRP